MNGTWKGSERERPPARSADPVAQPGRSGCSRAWSGVPKAAFLTSKQKKARLQSSRAMGEDGEEK
jgi:hypothetical protein